ncbi:facilitated trehalose transporter Tret1-like [Leptopilina heterotoma]|uniref:facilitated trehalose transporter Tret1-like n=1 Tax=Leptopilina heterotoma TaxID=63436 RepID=UPI001CA92A0C|nr:facilitated trehalose transporter Tret1-like [Leptopilina heterotoma]
MKNCCTSRIRQYFNKNDNKELKSDGSHSKQYMAAICACITIAVCGGGQSWSSPAIPYLTSKNSPFLVTDYQVTWISSLYNVGDLIGVLLNPLFIDRIGRKNTLLLSALPGLIGWCLIIFAKNYIHLYIARLLTGISQGSTLNCLVIYLTEISEKNIRGRLVNILHLSLSFGVFVFSAISAFTSYYILNISAALLMLLFLFVFPLSPETPYYYLLQQKKDDATKCMMRLRGFNSSEKVENEIREMILAIEEDRKNTKRFAVWELFSKSYNRKAVLIMFFMKMTQIMSGVNPLTYNAEEILSHNNLPIKPGVQVVMWHGIALPASLITGWILDKFERKIIFLSSGVFTTLCLIALGIYFFITDYLHKDTSSYGWLPLVALIVFQMSYTFGIGSIPYIIQGELFPIQVKGSAVCLGRIITDVFAFATTAGYHPMSNAYGAYTTLWFFALVTLFGSLVSFWIAIDTLRKSLEEIQALQNPELGRKLELERQNTLSRRR